MQDAAWFAEAAKVHPQQHDTHADGPAPAPIAGTDIFGSDSGACAHANSGYRSLTLPTLCSRPRTNQVELTSSLALSRHQVNLPTRTCPHSDSNLCTMTCSPYSRRQCGHERLTKWQHGCDTHECNVQLSRTGCIHSESARCMQRPYFGAEFEHTRSSPYLQCSQIRSSTAT